MIILFVVGYACIAFEHPLKINKTAFALMLGVLIWVVLILTGPGIFEVSGHGASWQAYLQAHPDATFADFITKDAEISKLVDANFVYIHVDYSPKSFKDNPARKKLTEQTMKRLGNPGRFGYPVFVVLDQKGRVIHTQDSSYLEEGQGYSKEKVVRFFRNWTTEAVQ